MLASLRAIAFYLPQFHPIPENDRWWGKGFTEWTNVAKARPLFRGHYQPHLPADLGFYDLRVPEVRAAQAEMARTYGLTGFCYYHYWFNGTRLLNRPFDEVLASGRPDFPFCLCWANENWTRRWDGYDHEVLLRQQYSFDDDLTHIEHLLPAFEDPRYIKIGGKPLLLVYRSEVLPDAGRTAALWRERVQKAGFPDLYLARVESWRAGIPPASINFDAAVEFAPDKGVVLPKFRSTNPLLNALQQPLIRSGLLRPSPDALRLYSYDALVAGMRAKIEVSYPRFRCVTPGWDNSARRVNGATIFVGSSPATYRDWLNEVVSETLSSVGLEPIIFINAWNEWAEGNHLEPDLRDGRAYLEATAEILRGAARGPASKPA